MSVMTTVVLPRAGGAGQELDRHRGGLWRSPRRRRRTRLLSPGLRRGRHPLDERWKRPDEAVRAFWLGESSSFKGAFCSTEGIVLEPYSAQRPAIWIGSWGSEAGLRQTAHVGYGWLLPTTLSRKSSPVRRADSENT